jgi:hypothetical protein
MANRRICNLRVNAICKFTQISSLGSIECFLKFKNGIWNIDLIWMEVFVKPSEVDQELVYEMYQTEIQGNDWVHYGLAPMTTTHIVRSWYEEW